MDESDWVNVKVGYDVEVTFDAIEDTIFTGEVIQVDPTLFSQGMTSMVRGYAQLDPIDPGTQLLIGMSGAVDVISSRAVNVVLVPIEALREITEGQYAVFVLEDGEPVLRMVEVGIQDLYYAEIKSGLQSGEIVTTGIVETSQ
jgi:multidrug efflux pump subunit AcrA (membrane-fusion protein)